MLVTLTKAEEIINILSKNYEIEVLKDTDLDLSDGTNLCLSIKNNPEIEEIEELIKPFKIKILKYGNMLIFKLN
jgi:hypothetical protein